MSEFLRLVLLLALAGSAVTMAGSAAAYWNDEERRLRRYLRRTLGGPPDAAIVALGRNAAAGFRLDNGKIVVMWDGGAKALLYNLPALVGAELLVDGAVAARVYRGEPRRALDQVATGARQVTLRLVFDNARDPDFDLDLWLPADEGRREAHSPQAAIQEARSWLARAEAILKLPAAAPQVAPRADPKPAPEGSEFGDDELPF